MQPPYDRKRNFHWRWGHTPFFPRGQHTDFMPALSQPSHHLADAQLISAIMGWWVESGDTKEFQSLSANLGLLAEEPSNPPLRCLCIFAHMENNFSISHLNRIFDRKT